MVCGFGCNRRSVEVLIVGGLSSFNMWKGHRRGSSISNSKVSREATDAAFSYQETGKDNHHVFQGRVFK